MIDHDEARRLVEIRLEAMARQMELENRDWTVELVIVDTTEHAFGWVFHWTTRENAETGRNPLAGNGPYIVNRFTGDIVETGTARPIDHYISAYEQKLLVS